MNETAVKASKLVNLFPAKSVSLEIFFSKKNHVALYLKTRFFGVRTCLLHVDCHCTAGLIRSDVSWLPVVSTVHPRT
jgi:hypothetical protein